MSTAHELDFTFDDLPAEPLRETRYCRVGSGPTMLGFAVTLRTDCVLVRISYRGERSLESAQREVQALLERGSSKIEGTTSYYTRTVRDRLRDDCNLRFGDERL